MKTLPCGLSKESPQLIAFPSWNQYLVLYEPAGNQKHWSRTLHNRPALQKTRLLTKKSLPNL